MEEKKQLICYQRKRRKTVNSGQGSKFHLDIVIEILSWLPVLSLLRFKCVCKQWSSLIQEDDKFVAKHRDRSQEKQLFYRWKPETRKVIVCPDGDFELRGWCGGLTVEKSATSKAWRIRNPATRQVLDLPDAPDDTTSMDLGFNPRTGEWKAVSYHCKDEGRQTSSLVGVGVLTFGKDVKWRSLIKQYSNQILCRKQVKWVLIPKPYDQIKVQWVAHLPEIINSCLQFQSLDLWSECITTTTLSQRALLESERLWTFMWDDCPAVAGLVGETLNVSLLVQDLKEHKWNVENRVIHLKFLQDDPQLKYQISHVIIGHHNVLRFGKSEQYLNYDTKTRTLTTSDIHDIQLKLEKLGPVFKTNLTSLKGMRLETSAITDQ